MLLLATPLTLGGQSFRSLGALGGAGGVCLTVRAAMHSLRTTRPQRLSLPSLPTPHPVTFPHTYTALPLMEYIYGLRFPPPATVDGADGQRCGLGESGGTPFPSDTTGHAASPSSNPGWNRSHQLRDDPATLPTTASRPNTSHISLEWQPLGRRILNRHTTRPRRRIYPQTTSPSLF